jgi:hypothetical protein
MIMLRTRIFKCLYVGVVTLLVLAFTVGVAGAQPVQAAHSTRLSAGWMPFAGSFPDSNIHLNGLVHIVARWSSVSSSETQVDISANLPATGVTVTTDTGIPYIAFGAGQSSSLFTPTDPIRLIVPSFLMLVGSDRALPPNPVLPPNPIRPFGLQFDLVFDAAGVLDFNASTVQIIELPGLGD